MVKQPEESSGFLLWQVTLGWQRAVTATLKPLGLTHVQFVLLASTWWLNSHDEEPSQAALSAFAGVDVKMASEVIRTLEGKGLVTRRVDEGDSRARRLVVTEAGAALAPRAIAAVEAVDDALLEPLSKAEGCAFTSSLRRLRDGLG